jgi:hypothetical protein
MQRHFSNRGEALAESTAARMLAGRKQSAKSVSIAPGDQRIRTGRWFAEPADTAHRVKGKQPNRYAGVTTLP